MAYEENLFEEFNELQNKETEHEEEEALKTKSISEVIHTDPDRAVQNDRNNELAIQSSTDDLVLTITAAEKLTSSAYKVHKFAPNFSSQEQSNFWNETVRHLF